MGRFDLANWKYLSIFLGVFARIVKVTHFAQVMNFRERIHGKTDSHNVDKNNRESTIFLFRFFFQHRSKTKFIVASSTEQQKQNFYCPIFFVAFVFRMKKLFMKKEFHVKNRKQETLHGFSLQNSVLYNAEIPSQYLPKQMHI